MKFFSKFLLHVDRLGELNDQIIHFSTIRETVIESFLFQPQPRFCVRLYGRSFFFLDKEYSLWVELVFLNLLYSESRDIQDDGIVFFVMILIVEK